MTNIDNLLKHHDNGDIDIDTLDPAEVVKKIFCNEWFEDEDTGFYTLSQIYDELHRALGDDFTVPVGDNLYVVDVISPDGPSYRVCFDNWDSISDGDSLQLSNFKLARLPIAYKLGCRWDWLAFTKQDANTVAEHYKEMGFATGIFTLKNQSRVLPWYFGPNLATVYSVLKDAMHV